MQAIGQRGREVPRPTLPGRATRPAARPALHVVDGVGPQRLLGQRGAGGARGEPLGRHGEDQAETAGGSIRRTIVGSPAAIVKPPEHRTPRCCRDVPRSRPRAASDPRGRSAGRRARRRPPGRPRSPPRTAAGRERQLVGDLDAEAVAVAAVKDAATTRFEASAGSSSAPSPASCTESGPGRRVTVTVSRSGSATPRQSNPVRDSRTSRGR